MELCRAALRLPERQGTGMIVFVSAMPQEIASFHLPRNDWEGVPRMLAGRMAGKQVWATATGMGWRPTIRVVDEMLNNMPIKALISIGFSGGTAKALRPGELVLCRKVRLAGMGDGPREMTCHAGLLEAARRAAGATPTRWSEGDGLTADHVASSAREKEELGRSYEVHAVDMESFWVGMAASERNVPFLAVRAILDPQAESVPDLNPFITADGRLRGGHAARHFALRPQSWPGFLRMGLGARRASRSLGVWAMAFAREVHP